MNNAVVVDDKSIYTSVHYFFPHERKVVQKIAFLTAIQDYQQSRYIVRGLGMKKNIKRISNIARANSRLAAEKVKDQKRMRIEGVVQIFAGKNQDDVVDLKTESGGIKS